MISFSNGQVLTGDALNALQQGLLQANSPTPLVLSGSGIQLSVVDTASITHITSSDVNAGVLNTGKINLGGVSVTSGSGAPTATTPVGSLYLRTDGTYATSLYVSGGAGAWQTVGTGGAGGGSGPAGSITGWSIDNSIIGATTPASGTFTTLNVTGTATGVTPTGGDNSTKLATTAYVQSAITGGTYNAAAVAITGGTIDGTSIGATTKSSGAFTTLSANSTVSGTGFSTYLASPPAIGGTAAAAGSFTTLSASSTVSGTGFSTYLASPPAIGGSAAAAGSFTTLSASSTFTTSAAEVKQTNVVTAAGGITMGAADRFIVVNKTSGAATAVTLVSSPTTGRVVTIIDGKGDAATNNITISPAAGTINGASSYVISSNYGEVSLIYNGTQWNLQSTRSNQATWSMQWTGGTVVTNNTYYFSIYAPYSGTINSLDWFSGTGSFTVNVEIGTTSVTGLSAVNVNSATLTNSVATAANTFAAGSLIKVIVTSATSSPTNAVLSLRITRS